MTSRLNHQHLYCSLQKMALWFLIHGFAEGSAPLKSACFHSPPCLNNKQGKKGGRWVFLISLVLSYFCIARPKQSQITMNPDQVKSHYFATVAHPVLLHVIISFDLFWYASGHVWARVCVCFAVTMARIQKSSTWLPNWMVLINLMQKWTTPR